MTQQESMINGLNGMLKGELSAVETYRIALEKVQDPGIKDKLKECHMCHNSRIDTLVEKINALGGNAAENSGTWGLFAKAIERGAASLGDKAAVAALEEGEDKGLSDYKKMIHDENLEIKSVALTLLPRQEATHSIMRDLKHALEAA